MKAVEGRIIDNCYDCPNYVYVFDWDSSMNDTSWCDERSVGQREIISPSSIPSWCPLPGP